MSIDKRTAKQQLKHARNHVAELARLYRTVNANYIKLGYNYERQDKIYLMFCRYSDAKAVLLSCQCVLEKSLSTLNLYRKGCDDFTKGEI